MQSADFQIIPQSSHVNQMQTGANLQRYLVTYASTDQPQFIAVDERGRFILVDDETSAARFPSIADAEAWVVSAIERGESLAKHLGLE